MCRLAFVVGLCPVSHVHLAHFDGGEKPAPASNVQGIVWPSVRQGQPKAMLRFRLLAVQGRSQRQGDACSLIAKRFEDLTPLLRELETSSRDFR